MGGNFHFLGLLVQVLVGYAFAVGCVVAGAMVLAFAEWIEYWPDDERKAGR